MDRITQPSNFARAVRLMHAAMTAGCVLVGGVFVLVRRLGQGPTLAGQATIGVVLAVAGVALLAVAAALVRPRVPERVANQTAEAYWTAAETRGPAIVLWAMVEGAGLVSLVGYLLTGGVPPAVATALAIVTLVLFRPTRLEGEGAA
jgi:Na+/melibiose symporter-like transporter